MSNVYLRNTIRFVVLVLVQVFILNNMNINGYLNPYIYVLFILMLPVRINKSLLLILAFITGLTIDFFGNSLGLHAAATVLLAFARPGILSLMFKNTDFDVDEAAAVNRIGIRQFLAYSFVLILLHHTSLFLLEAFTFRDFHLILYKVLLSSILSTLIIMISVLLFSKRKS